ncbi:hypothetical protein D3C71_1942520 [compost metagenome]
MLPINIARYEGFSKALKEVPCPSLALPRLSVRMLWLPGRPLGATALYVQQRFTELLGDGAV